MVCVTRCNKAEIRMIHFLLYATGSYVRQPSCRGLSTSCLTFPSTAGFLLVFRVLYILYDNPDGPCNLCLRCALFEFRCNSEYVGMFFGFTCCIPSYSRKSISNCHYRFQPHFYLIQYHNHPTIRRSIM